MPQAVTHVLTTAILADIYRDYFAKHKHLFTMHHVFVAGIGGLLPDIDIPLQMITQKTGIETGKLLSHGGITHTLLFALLFLIPGTALWLKKSRKTALYFILAGLGIIWHITLDYVLGGGGHYGIMWFYPLSNEGYKIGLLGRSGLTAVPQALDALVLILWLWHEEYKHKIKDFI